MTFYILYRLGAFYFQFLYFSTVFYKPCQLCVLVYIIMQSFSKPGAVVRYVCRLYYIF